VSVELWSSKPRKETTVDIIVGTAIAAFVVGVLVFILMQPSPFRGISSHRVNMLETRRVDHHAQVPQSREPSMVSRHRLNMLEDQWIDARN
jgi:hypothetical protein